MRQIPDPKHEGDQADERKQIARPVSEREAFQQDKRGAARGLRQEQIVRAEHPVEAQQNGDKNREKQHRLIHQTPSGLNAPTVQLKQDEQNGGGVNRKGMKAEIAVWWINRPVRKQQGGNRPRQTERVQRLSNPADGTDGVDHTQPDGERTQMQRQDIHGEMPHSCENEQADNLGESHIAAQYTGEPGDSAADPSDFETERENKRERRKMKAAEQWKAAVRREVG